MFVLTMRMLKKFNLFPLSFLSFLSDITRLKIHSRRKSWRNDLYENKLIFFEKSLLNDEKAWTTNHGNEHFWTLLNTALPLTPLIFIVLPSYTRHNLLRMIPRTALNWKYWGNSILCSIWVNIIHIHLRRKEEPIKLADLVKEQREVY